MGKLIIRKNAKILKAFVQDVTATLVDGKPYRTVGLGTFSICVRKQTAEHAACKMAMFRASSELRDYASGGTKPEGSGPHAEVVSMIIEAMQCEEGVVVPSLGRFAVIPVAGKKPKLIFHATQELNEKLTLS